jgi:ribose 5-phosphate isomerase B
MPEQLQKIAIGSDHAGYCLKEYVKKMILEWGLTVEDFGTYSEESVDYPDLIHPLARAVNEGMFPRAVIICGSGNGVSMVANKYPNVRAALCWKPEIAVLARQHNDANIIALPARFITDEIAAECVKMFINTDFEGGRHKRRVEKIPKGS